MGFWTSIECFRPGPPPRVTCGELAGVVRAVGRLGVLRGGLVSAGVRIGDPAWGRLLDRVRVDPGLSDEEYVALEAVDPLSEPDINLWRADSLEEIAGALEARAGDVVESAQVGLGGLAPEVVERLYVRSDQNEQAVCLDCVSLSIAPVTLGSLNGDRVWYVGGAAVTVGRQGYCWPRTRGEVCAAVRAEGSVRAVVGVVRGAMGSGGSVDAAMRRAWREMGEVFCGEEEGWGWGAGES